ncbi:hypothetical protein TWF751_005050 [Orbilia oligospora]|uniref:Uncharacterized protein n=1 Tax=Orbilia oligospora TaxID=2813651 RepID=A0A7C8NWH8_ORBOL|nr:hypothetical protein TWF703_000053 [Orbilia oligospora]KAF3151676.1 hypothetical protein TWF751_005050 [Orbilia oligospora]
MRITFKEIQLLCVLVLILLYLQLQTASATLTMLDFGDGSISNQWSPGRYSWCLKDNQCTGGAPNNTLSFEICHLGEFLFNPSTRWGFMGNVSVENDKIFWRGAIVNRYTSRCLTFQVENGSVTAPIQAHDEFALSSTNMEAQECHRAVGRLTTTPCCLSTSPPNFWQTFSIFSLGSKYQITVPELRVCERGKGTVSVESLYGQAWLGCKSKTDEQLRAWDLITLRKLF